MPGRRILSLGVIVLAASFVLTGCADKLTRERFDLILISHADSYDVEQTIGEPSDKLEDTWHYERVDKHLNALVHFDDQGKVWRKQWHDTLNGIHFDSHEPGGDSSTHESTTVRKVE